MAVGKIYVLHEYGARSHYLALTYLAQLHGDHVVFAEFNISQQASSCKRSLKNIPHLIRNILILLYLYCTSGKKVVIGIAPLNKALSPIMKLTRNHSVYYHTSYVYWDGSSWAHPETDKENIWRDFTNNFVKHIFAVSSKTKSEIICNGFAQGDKVSVVYHSYEKVIDVPSSGVHNNNSFIFSGRLTECKGIIQLLEFFSQHPNATITFVGDGNLKKEVLYYSKRYNNISYVNWLTDKEELMKLYLEHSFVVMNSIRTSSWEELFGISIIEGMACGCVPIAVDHSGPLEIVTDGYDGFVFKEGDIPAALNKALLCSDEEYISLRRNAIERSQQFSVSEIAKCWAAVYNQ